MRKSINRIPDKILKEIFPRGLNRGLASERVYSHLKQMILSGKVKKGRRIIREIIAQDLNVSENAVSIAFSKLKKDGLVIIKWGKGSFVASSGLMEFDKELPFEKEIK
jgi:DNA-binding GntR family transcriptional regulator